MALIIGPTLAQACELPEGWQRMSAKAPTGTTKAAINVTRAPVALGQPFTVDIRICADAGETIERIGVDATMPAHRHGMNYRPEVTQTGENAYTASGLLFHMRGEWQIAVSAYGADSTTLFTLDVPAE